MPSHHHSLRSAFTLKSNWITRWFRESTRPSQSRRRSRLISPLRLIDLEERITPANVTLGGGTLTIDYTAAGVTAEAVTVTNDGVNVIVTGDAAGSLTNPVGSVFKIVVTDSGGSTAQSLTLAGIYSLSGGLASTGIESVTVHAVITATGAGAVSITGQAITTTEAVTTSGGSISLQATGDITLRAGVVSGGGAQTFKADSDGDGVGAFTLALPITEFVDPNPATGNGFGSNVVALTTGNVVVTSPGDDFGGSNAGAVYLFNGATGALISTLRGSTGNDSVGNGGVTALSNGSFVVRSTSWDNGAVADAGAVTWGNGTSGVSGAVSAVNSLVGSTASDAVGSSGIIPLTNGNYVVLSRSWDNGAVVDAGAVTWGNGSTGISGLIASANSLVGSTANDNVGISDGVTALTNGNYVIANRLWDNGAVVDAGAVTWGNGSTGISGLITSANSLVGSTAADLVGGSSATALTSGNYVIVSQSWDNGAVVNAGAVTWGNGTTGITGVVSPVNSLVGSSGNDSVGSGGLTKLNNGNYVVASPNWDNGAVLNAGAVTWGNGGTGISGVITLANSLLGSTSSDSVGSTGVTALTNGNYVVRSANWDNGAVTDAGAATWGNGTIGISGVVSSANSLLGSTSSDSVSNAGVTALTNGNYVVVSPNWDNGAVTSAGAVTWGNGVIGISGVVSSANSLVGSTKSDSLGSGGVTALTNGNYLVASTNWDNGAVVNAGAVTWGNGTTGVSGAVSLANSLVGSTTNDKVGNSIMLLTNGNYVIRSSTWNNGAVLKAGAATWGNGTTGVTGVVSTANSLVGSTGSDGVGGNGATALFNGNYVLLNTIWDNGGVVDAGAATWGNGTTSVSGTITTVNSAIGSVASAGLQSAIVADTVNGNFYARFLTDSGGRVRIGYQASGYAFTSGLTSAGGTVTITAAQINLGAGINSAGGAITLTSTGAITQTAGIVDTAGTLTVNSGAPATFVSIGNNAGSLVIPIGGTCLVNGSFLSSGAVQVDGTLGGAGSVGTTTVTATGKIAPGNSPGKLTTGNIVFNSGSVINVELNGAVAGSSYDQLAIVGTLNLGSATLNAALGYSPVPSQVFKIIDNDGTGDAVTGTFNGLIEGATVVISGINFTISYLGGDGNDVTLTAPAVIPPASPPTVTSVVLSDGTNAAVTHRSMVRQIIVTFSGPVTFTAPIASAFSLFRSLSSTSAGPNANVSLIANPASGPTSSVEITFSGALSESSGSLIDGIYDFTIDASKIAGAGGNLDGDNNTTPGGNYTVTGSIANKWYRLFGDDNGDGTVNQTDFNAFRLAFLGGPNVEFDFDGDNQVSQPDFNAFRLRFLGSP